MRKREIVKAERDPLTGKVSGAAIEVHRHLGPGLLESANEECLCWELMQAGAVVRRPVPRPVVYKSMYQNPVGRASGPSADRPEVGPPGSIVRRFKGVGLDLILPLLCASVPLW